MEVEEKYIQRCLQLALLGKGYVSPNPLVGAVLVHDGKIIGEGYHRMYGQPHAEVNAIASVKDHSLLPYSTMYVNLEPCSHYGKTPPCSSLIIEKKIPRVVIGHLDPYPEVSGRGIRMLKEAGLEVITDFMKEKCEKINKRFLTFYREKRPYIILKWAQSSDGYMDKKREHGDGLKAVSLSNDLTRMMVHKMRAEEDAIMVGTRTALLDNPSLNVRFWIGKDLLRIALDKQLKIPDTYNLHNGKNPTLIFTANEKKQDDSFVNYCKIDFDKDILPQIMEELYKKKVQSLIVEGGAQLLSSFIQSGIWDEIDVETAPGMLGSGVSSPFFKGQLHYVKKCKQSLVSVYKNPLYPKKL